MSSWFCLAALCVTAALPGADDYLKGHDALRAARYGDAVKAFTACAAKGGPLVPYAKLRKAFCAAASGDRDGGAKAYQRLLKEYPHGPWVRMAKTYLGLLLALKEDYRQASTLYADALSFEPKPWWVDLYDAAAADACVHNPDTASRGYAYYRNVIAATRLIDVRVEAAKHLVESSDSGDRLVAAWGMIKSGECKQALDILLALAPTALTGAMKDFDWKGYAAALESKGKPQTAGPNPLCGLANSQADNPWARLWLAYVARTQIAAGRIEIASLVCELLLDAFGKSEQASDALWWLAGRLAKDGKRAQAIEQYLRFVKKFPDSTRADDALFLAADMQRALAATKDFIKTVHLLSERYPQSSLLPKAWYWVGCAEQKEGDKKQAAEAFRRAAAHGMGDFYAHRALVRLHGAKDAKAETGRDIKVDGATAFLKAFPLPSESPPEVPREMLSEPSLQRLAFFATYGLEESEWEALDLAPRLKSDPEAEALYQALAEAGLAYTAVNYADAFQWENAGGKPSVARRRLDYPRAYWPHVLKVSEETGVDPYLILAVARQESTFRPRLVSYAGAVGVMQVMPSTAEQLAKSPDIPKETASNLESPLNSLRLGAHYLSEMLARWKGNVAFALASYNAGPGNCAKWQKQFAKADLETFIESIPFAETREYVKIVLGNYAAYYSLYPPLDKKETGRK